MFVTLLHFSYKSVTQGRQVHCFFYIRNLSTHMAHIYNNFRNFFHRYLTCIQNCRFYSFWQFFGHYFTEKFKFSIFHANFQNQERKCNPTVYNMTIFDQLQFFARLIFPHIGHFFLPKINGIPGLIFGLLSEISS